MNRDCLYGCRYGCLRGFTIHNQHVGRGGPGALLRCVNILLPYIYEEGRRFSFLRLFSGFSSLFFSFSFPFLLLFSGFESEEKYKKSIRKARKSIRKAKESRRKTTLKLIQINRATVIASYIGPALSGSWRSLIQQDHARHR